MAARPAIVPAVADLSVAIRAVREAVPDVDVPSRAGVVDQADDEADRDENDAESDLPGFGMPGGPQEAVETRDNHRRPLGASIIGRGGRPPRSCRGPTCPPSDLV